MEVHTSAVADEPLFAWQIDTPVHEVIGQAVGLASMCWEYPERAGVFDVALASRVVDEVMAILQAKLWTDEGKS